MCSVCYWGSAHAGRRPLPGFRERKTAQAGGHFAGLVGKYSVAVSMPVQMGCERLVYIYSSTGHLDLIIAYVPALLACIQFLFQARMDALFVSLYYLFVL